MDPKTKKTMAGWVFSWAIWRTKISWKVVGGVVGAASGQVGSAPFFAEGWGLRILSGKVGHVLLKIWAQTSQTCLWKFC